MDIAFTRAKWTALVASLSGNSDRKANISLALAGEFNLLLEKTAAQFPALKDHLPRALDKRSPFNQIGMTAIPSADLKTLCEQVLALLSVLTG